MEAVYPQGSYYYTSASNFNPVTMNFPGANDDQWILDNTSNGIYRWHRLGTPSD